MKYRHAIFALALLLTGCGGATEWPSAGGHLADNAQSIRVDTPGVDGAACALQNSAGSYLVMSPAIVRVNRASGPISVACTKGEHFRGTTTVAARRVEDAYSYPESISVSMGMNSDSLQRDIKVF